MHKIDLEALRYEDDRSVDNHARLLVLCTIPQEPVRRAGEEILQAQENKI